MRRLSVVLSFVASLLTAAAAHACPFQAGLVDFNCDGVQKIAVVGDSFVAGVGDTDEPNGGYYSRLQTMFPDATIVRYGVPGVTTSDLLSKLKRAVPTMESGPADKNLIDSDVLIVDVGRNDYFSENNPPKTVQNIKRIVKYLTDALKARGQGVAPVIAVATPLPTKRLFQRFFIVYTGDLLIQQRSSTLPTWIRLEKLSKSFVSKDGLHPNSQGYLKIAQVIKKYLEGKGTQRALALRPDQDADGVYDYFETTRYGTSPSLLDTDGDGISDSQEIFTLSSNPLDPASP